MPCLPDITTVWRQARTIRCLCTSAPLRPACPCVAGVRSMKKPRRVALSLHEVIAYELSEAEGAGFEHPLRLVFMDKDDFALVLRFDAGHGGSVKGSMLAEPPGGAKNRKSASQSADSCDRH